MLTEQILEEFKQRGLIVAPNFLSGESVRNLRSAIEDLQSAAKHEDGRWQLRCCVGRHQAFVELLLNEELLAIMVQLFGDCNIKLLESQIVKMSPKIEAKTLPVVWHRDGGALCAELPEPLPLFLIKAGFCISGSSQPGSGELLMVPASNHLVGDLPFDSQTGQPVGDLPILLEPGDAVFFDSRVWHAVNHNSNVDDRTIVYYGLGPRPLAAMEQMPQVSLAENPVLWQLFGGTADCGLDYYLPPNDLPLKKFEKAKRGKRAVGDMVDACREPLTT